MPPSARSSPGRSGRQLWRSLDELAETPAFAAFLENEFPQHAAALASAVDRRHFLKLMGASLGLAGLSACTQQPEEKIVPYVKQPEQIVPGEPLFFATAMPLGGFGIGVLVESHVGRPTKVEGNPDHPASLGATDSCDAGVGPRPLRSRPLAGHQQRGRDPHLERVRRHAQAALGVQRARRGAGLRILTETVTSPTLAEQLPRLLAAFPEARWHQYEPFGRDGARGSARSSRSGRPSRRATISPGRA